MCRWSHVVLAACSALLLSCLLDLVSWKCQTGAHTPITPFADSEFTDANAHRRCRVVCARLALPLHARRQPRRRRASAERGIERRERFAPRARARAGVHLGGEHRRLESVEKHPAVYRHAAGAADAGAAQPGTGGGAVARGRRVRRAHLGECRIHGFTRGASCLKSLARVGVARLACCARCFDDLRVCPR